MTIILANILASRYNFIDEELAETVCQVFEIKIKRLIRAKQIQSFNG